MKNNGKPAAKYPRGWDEKRVRQVIAHYEKQTDDERLAEIRSASINDAWRRFTEATKQFNETDQSKLVLTPIDAETVDATWELIEEVKHCWLNWCGPDSDGTVSSVHYYVRFAAQSPVAEHLVRPVLCTICKEFVSAPELPRSRKAIAELMAINNTEGVKLELDRPLPEADQAFLEGFRGDGVKPEARERKKGLFIHGVSTTVYAKFIDSETLCDSLIRLNRSMANLREKLGLEKLAW